MNKFKVNILGCILGSIGGIMFVIAIIIVISIYHKKILCRIDFFDRRTKI